MAERAWAAAKSTTSIAVLEAFHREYGSSNTFYDRLAEARIIELKKQQVAVAVPAPTPVPTPQIPWAGKSEYQPRVGQPGKDVVWVPTAQTLVDKILDMAKVTPNDYVVDLGSGDGRQVISAAKRGAKALGIEYDQDLVELSRRNAEKAGVSGKVTFVKADIFASDFSQATVLSLFLLTDLNIRLRPTILNMKPGTRVVSNTFGMGDWTPDETVQASDGCKSFCRANLWIVPAKVDARGNWGRVSCGWSRNTNSLPESSRPETSSLQSSTAN